MEKFKYNVLTGLDHWYCKPYRIMEETNKQDEQVKRDLIKNAG